MKSKTGKKYLCKRCKNDFACDPIFTSILKLYHAKIVNEMCENIPAEIVVKFEDTVVVKKCENFVKK